MTLSTCGACLNRYDLARQSQVCPHPKRTAETQTDRLIAFLRTHPQATSLEITLACGIVNTTGRISDARAQGFVVVCETRSDGRKGYRVVETRPPIKGEQVSAW